MKIARTVSSNSHIDYVARILDRDEDDLEAPDPSNYGFGQFVSLEGDGESVIGVIYDSRLVNPEYGSFAPRSGPRAELARQNADHVREQGILIGILLLGTIDASGRKFQGVPPRIVPVGRDVKTLDTEAVVEFHTEDGNLHLHYYPQVVSNARQFAIPLLGSIIDHLMKHASEGDQQRLRVLRQSLQWQGTFGAIKL